MYLVFTQISHIHSHLPRLIAQAQPCFCLVFTRRGVGEMGRGWGGGGVSITMQVEHEMIRRGAWESRKIAAGESAGFELEERAGLTRRVIWGGGWWWWCSFRENRPG